MQISGIDFFFFLFSWITKQKSASSIEHWAAWVQITSFFFENNDKRNWNWSKYVILMNKKVHYLLLILLSVFSIVYGAQLSFFQMALPMHHESNNSKESYKLQAENLPNGIEQLGFLVIKYPESDQGHCRLLRMTWRIWNQGISK